VNSRRHLWSAVAVALVVVGIAGSVLGAHLVAQNDAQRSHQAFATTSAQIASTLTLAIQHEQDLTASASAYFAGNPNPTEAEFLGWTNAVRAFQRYPDLQLIGEITLVPAAELGAFAARAEADPAGPLSPDGTFQVVPAGNRPFYCFEPVAAGRTTQSAPPAGFDYCDGPLGSALLAARDSGADSYLPARVGKTSVLGVGVAVYQGGTVPTSVAGRRAAFIGWTGMEVHPGVLLATALRGHPGVAVAFHYGDGASKVTFRAGSAPAGSQLITIPLHNGWHVDTTGAVGGGGLFSSHGALAVLLGGIVLSLLFGALIEVLGLSRSRAIGLVRHQSFHDGLTGLPNRALIIDRMDQMLRRARRTHTPVAALLVDLDNFKDINDTLGHRAGDQLLAAVGKRLASALREVDTVGRLGSDEFVVLVEGSSLAAGAGVVADRILDVLRTPFEIASSKIPLALTGSIGVALGDRVTADQLLRDADTALYRAKADGKKCFVVFSHSMQEADDDRRHLEGDLHDALEAGQFFLLYQPTVDLSTGTFTGVEALLRWRHPRRGVVQPDDFIPSLERSGLIVPVGQWVLETACRQGAEWHRRGHQITVSVNVSARQLERDRIVDDVHGALAASGFDPCMLLLELTETTLMQDVDATSARLALLKAIGVRIAIDDFGTGYSSLAYLRHFPIDVLKIDRSFVSGIGDTTEAGALVHTLVQLGKVLGLETIAEGIETDDQRLRLKAESVDGGQGFLYSRPLTVEQVDQLLNEAALASRESHRHRASTMLGRWQ
jgi:diguanylate cyclase (GGDEF)-like protein